jgi:hypothetical protein
MRIWHADVLFAFDGIDEPEKIVGYENCIQAMLG